MFIPRVRFWWPAIAMAVAGASFFACGSGTKETFDGGADVDGGAGSFGQACYPNDTCNVGLSCLGDVCAVSVTDGGLGSEGNLSAESGSDGNTGDATSNVDSSTCTASVSRFDSVQACGGGGPNTDSTPCFCHEDSDDAQIVDCVNENNHACLFTVQDKRDGLFLECQSRVDCGSGVCCLETVTFDAGGTIASDGGTLTASCPGTFQPTGMTACQSSCSTGGLQLCATDQECSNPKHCEPFVATNIPQLSTVTWGICR